MTKRETPKLYSQLASWWPLLSSPVDYAEEAAHYRKVLVEVCEQLPRTLLELGSGGGNNASHLKAHFQMTLTDRSREMREVSRALNPNCEHMQGDMRTVRLDRRFDAVFIFAYLLRQEDGSVQIEYDQHSFGLFSREQWLELLAEVGFQPRVIPFQHSKLQDPYSVFIGSKRY